MFPTTEAVVSITNGRESNAVALVGLSGSRTPEAFRAVIAFRGTGLE